MRIIQLQICLLMVSTVTESVTNTAVSLGADEIISCDLDIKEVYWYRQISPDPPQLILRTFDSTYEGAEYENIIFKLKYSVKTNSRLFIRNISSDELGVYYCVRTSEPLKFSNGSKIYIRDSVHENQSESDETRWRNLTTITSVLISVLLIVTLIGLVKSYTDKTRRSSNYTSAINNLQCAEIVFPMCPGNINLIQEQSEAVVYRQCLM